LGSEEIQKRGSGYCPEAKERINQVNVGITAKNAKKT